MFEAGEADPFVPYAGLGREANYRWGQQDAVAYLARQHGCDPKPATTGFGSSGTLQRDVFSPCAKAFRGRQPDQRPQRGPRVRNRRGAGPEFRGRAMEILGGALVARTLPADRRTE